MDDTEQKQKHYGVRHWLFQVLPPGLILLVLFATENGSGLVFILGIFLLPVLVSVVSLIAKLIFLHKRKYFLLRPGLTIAFFILVFQVANLSYSVALDQAVAEAEKIQMQCIRDAFCTSNPAGWTTNGMRASQRFGSWFVYQANYRADDKVFVIDLFQGPDLGDTITGGVNLAVKSERYTEN